VRPAGCKRRAPRQHASTGSVTSSSLAQQQQQQQGPAL
jgi:hypothetical protein